MERLIVSKKDNGKKLNRFLISNIEGLSDNLFYKTLRKKDIKINNIRVNSNIEVHTGDEILIYVTKEMLKPKIKLDIVYEDENILIINKPYNIEVEGDNSLTNLIQKKYNKNNIKPCHRIDRNTCGLVLFSKNEEALKILLEKFKKHEIEKHYLAKVYGRPKENYKRCEAYLFKDNKKAKVYISDEPKKGYRKIITTYRVIERKNDNTAILDV